MRRLTLLSFLIAFGACGEVTQPAAPEATEVNPPAPSFNFSNGPVHPGNSVVLRGGLPNFWIGTDPARNLVSVNGLGPWIRRKAGSVLAQWASTFGSSRMP